MDANLGSFGKNTVFQSKSFRHLHRQRRRNGLVRPLLHRLAPIGDNVGAKIHNKLNAEILTSDL
jgi:hypothetical protein